MNYSNQIILNVDIYHMNKNHSSNIELLRSMLNRAYIPAVTKMSPRRIQTVQDLIHNEKGQIPRGDIFVIYG
jgi:hypothetical protein